MRREPVGRNSMAVFCLSLLLVVSAAAAHEGHEHGGDAQAMVIAAVVPGGPAAAAGLAEGDRILSWQGEQLSTQADLDSFLAARRAGDAVALAVERGGEVFEVSLTFGDRGDGGPRLGISLGVEASGPGEARRGDEVNADECRAWLADTYRLESTAEELGVALAQSTADIQACVDRDLARMPSSIPRGWCDNVFKVHCSGLDALAELGDAIVERCREQLASSLDADPAAGRAWATCAEQRVFDAYSVEGQVSDAAACRAILVDDCGAELGDG